MVKSILTRPLVTRREIERLVERVDELWQSLPIVLNAIESANAAARVRERRMLELERRVIAFETRSRAGASDDANLTNTFLEAPRRLILGAEPVEHEGYFSVDDRPCSGVDFVADLRALPFAEASIDEIRAEHVLQRFPLEHLRHDVLPHWYRLLRPGGRLVTVVTDGATMFRNGIAGRTPIDEVEGELFAQEFGAGGSVFTSRSVADLLLGAGFTEVEVRQASGSQDPRPDLVVHAIRPAV